MTSVNFLDLLNNKTILYLHRLIAKGIFDKVANKSRLNLILRFLMTRKILQVGTILFFFF